MARKKEPELNFLEELQRGLDDVLNTSESALDIGIIDFINHKIDAYDLEPLLGNRVVLKAFCNEPFDEEEQALMDKWVAEGKTNWRPPADIVAEQNFARILDGKEPLDPDKFEWRELIVEGGMRGGKTQIGAFLNLRILYSLLYTPREEWREKFDIPVPTGTPLYITCLAATESSTATTIYGQICAYLTGSRVFKRLIDEGRLIVTAESIKFPESNLTVMAGNSRAAGQVGRAAFVVTFDEIAFHMDSDGKSNGKDLYDRLGRSTTNLGKRGKIIAISSVRQEGDFMQELQAVSWDKQHRGCLCFRLATWDLNETLSLDSDVIGKAYEVDVVAARRDYENIRPANESAFLDPEIVDRAITHENTRHINWSKHQNTVTGVWEGKQQVQTFVSRKIERVDQFPQGFFSVAHCDPGISGDSFAIAIGHAEPHPEGIATVIDFVIDWVPERGKRGEKLVVDFPNVEEIILKLWKARNIMRLTFDHWQSQDHIQRLWRAGVPAREDNFNRTRQTEGYVLLRDRINKGLLKIPNYPTLVEELKNLELKNGEKVDHPKNKISIITRRPIGKDLADCVMVVDQYIAKAGAAFARTPNKGAGIIMPHNAFHTAGQSRSSQINWGFR